MIRQECRPECPEISLPEGFEEWCNLLEEGDLKTYVISVTKCVLAGLSPDTQMRHALATQFDMPNYGEFSRIVQTVILEGQKQFPGISTDLKTISEEGSTLNHHGAIVFRMFAQSQPSTSSNSN